jgi:hypothetical protein
MGRAGGYDRPRAATVETAESVEPWEARYEMDCSPLTARVTPVHRLTEMLGIPPNLAKRKLSCAPRAGPR